MIAPDHAIDPVLGNQGAAAALGTVLASAAQAPEQRRVKAAAASALANTAQDLDRDTVLAGPAPAARPSSSKQLGVDLDRVLEISSQRILR